MKVSYEWLQSFFDETLPAPDEAARLLTMHAYEVEGMEKRGNDTLFEIDILPNRSHDSLSHRGIARELSAMTGLSLKKEEKKIIQSAETAPLSITVEDEKICRRYVGRVLEGVKVGPSPKWLVARLEAVGQRSINNVVDATNYAMLHLGEPLHAFDANKLSSYEVIVRRARAGEQMTTLDGQEVLLSEDALVIADAESPLALAGIKGGMKAEVTETTTDIILEAANFEPKNVRRISQAAGIRTDSSIRFEREITPELAQEAMDFVTALIVDIAGTSETKVGKAVDVYPRRQNPYLVGISTEEANRLLGTMFSDSDISNVFDRLGFSYEKRKPIEYVLSIARQFEGKPYQWGASITYDAPERFDCASLTGYLFTQGGVQIPRMTVDQYIYGKPVSEKDMKAGDLIFANTGIIKRGIHTESKEYLPGTPVPEGVDHVGLYLGDGKIMHGTESVGVIVIQSFAESEQFKNIVGMRRMYEGPERFVVSIPAERLDIRIPADLAEEIGRIVGYDAVPEKKPSSEAPPRIPKDILFRDALRDVLFRAGFSEVITSSFTAKGDSKKHRLLENPIAEDKKYLRHAITEAFPAALEQSAYYKDLLGIDAVKIFEIGKVFDEKGERWVLAIGVKKLMKGKKAKQADEVLAESFAVLSELCVVSEKNSTITTDQNAEMCMAEIDLTECCKAASEESLPKSRYGILPDISYKPLSKYPFVARDISLFVPEGILSEKVETVLREHAGELLAHSTLFDRFEKDGKTSYAFRLVFQSYEKTLSDEEVNDIMDDIYRAAAKEQWEVR